MKAIISLLIAASLLFSGCASTGSTTATGLSPRGESIARVSVKVAVIKVLRNNPDRAARVIAISSLVRQVAGQEKFDTVSLLDGFIRSQIDWSKLEPEDIQIANMLLDEIRAELETRIGSGKLTTDKLLVVAEVAEWIESAAKAVAPR